MGGGENPKEKCFATSYNSFIALHPLKHINLYYICQNIYSK